MKDKRQYYLDCGIKTAWHNRTLDDFEGDEVALQKVKSYISQLPKMKQNGIGLFLWGENGTGKSLLMNSAFIQLINSGDTVRVYGFDELIDLFTASWYSDEHKAELNNTLRNVKFLGIDEFGKNIDSEGNPKYLPDLAKRVIESIIRSRVQMNKPIWITSNTDPKNVAAVFSEDVASLLREATIPIKVAGQDFRKVIQKRNKELL